MPKTKKIRSAALASQAVRHEPLGQVITEEQNKKKYVSPSQRLKRQKINESDVLGADDEINLTAKESRKILEMSKQQQLEVEAEQIQKERKARTHHNRPAYTNDSDDDDSLDDGDHSGLEDDDPDERLVERDQGYVTLVDQDIEGISAEDQALIDSMMKPSEERRTLADIIMEKIDEKEAEKKGLRTSESEFDLPPKVVEVYTEIGQILSRYTSGKLPKAFKVIPSLSNWEEILYLTRPDLWTPQAMYQATRLFASNLNPKMAQRFYYLVLLDAVRADITMNKKLNYHYYMSLKKCVYKPAAFFKGILLPLCQESCTLREAGIVASVLQRVSIPVHHSAVAIFKLANMEFSGAQAIFIRTLLNKKYSLPAPVISSLVEYFGGFVQDDREFPVLWHQCLLVFVQRYKNEVQDEAREMLRRVMKKHFHHKITPEIRRELFGTQAWKDERRSLGKASENSSSGMVLD